VQKPLNTNEGKTGVRRNGKADWLGEDIMSWEREKIIVVVEVQ
jgi:hypothetical protein